MIDNRTDPTNNAPEPLTDREREILGNLIEGLSNQDIATRRHLALRTVKWYNSQIYSKLGVSNRREAVERAQALGLLSEKFSATSVVGKHNLPTQATPFVGRQQELTELTNLFKDQNTRLITILAPGGMGKTRLALEAARLQIGRFSDGVIFVPLAPLGNANAIVTTIAENISFSFYGENSPAKQLIDFLRDRSMLLVLDNFEHLLDGVQMVADLIQVASHIHLLTTSRERLNLKSETVYTLRGLEFPTWETPEDAMQYDAVKLFMHSAHRVRSDFELQAYDLDYLTRICRLTEGMPLGIELAAGWVDVLSLEQIVSEIQQGIDILETELRDVPERQRSIRATFNRTWERLTADEQAVFMRLSVFRGGFTVQAAQMVAGAGVRSLRQLANKALVQVSPDNHHDIHELLRQFGAEKLTASGEESVIQAKHAAYFADFMAERKPETRNNSQLEALKLIDTDFENVRSAWLYTVHQQQWEQLPKFLHSLWFYLDIRTRGREGVELLEQAVKMLQSLPSSTVTQLAMGRVLARLSWFMHDIGASERGSSISDESILILRQHESPDDLLMALYSRALTAWFQNQLDIAIDNSQEGIRIAQSINDKGWEGHFLIWLGLDSVNDKNTLALPFAEAGLAVFEETGDRWGLRGIYGILARINYTEHDYEQASYWHEKGLVIEKMFGHVWGIGMSYSDLGKINLAMKDYTQAHLNLRKGLQTFWDGGYKWIIAVPLVYIAHMFADQNELESAVEVRAAIEQHLGTVGLTYEVAQILRDQLKTKLEPDRFAAAWARGAKRELSAVVAELLSEITD